MARRRSSGSGEVAGGAPGTPGRAPRTDHHQRPANVVLLSAHMTADGGSNTYEEVFVPSPAAPTSEGTYDVTSRFQPGYKFKTLPRSAKFSLNHSGNDKVKTSKLSAMKIKFLGRSVEKEGQINKERTGKNGVTPPETPPLNVASTKANRRGLLGSKALSRSMESLFKSRKLTRTNAIDLGDSAEGHSHMNDGACERVMTRNFDGPRLTKPTGPPPPVPVNASTDKTKPRSKSLDFDEAFDSDDETGSEGGGTSRSVTVLPGAGVCKPTGPPPPVPAMGPATRRLRARSVDMSKYHHGAGGWYNVYGNVAVGSAPRPTVPPPPVPGSAAAATTGDDRTATVINSVMMMMTAGHEDISGDTRDDVVIGEDQVGTDIIRRQVALHADAHSQGGGGATSEGGGAQPSAAPWIPTAVLPGSADTPLPTTAARQHAHGTSNFRRSLSLDCLPDQCDTIDWDTNPTVITTAGDHHSGSQLTAHHPLPNVDIGQRKSRPAVKKKPGIPPKPKPGAGLLGSLQKKSFSQSLESLLVRREGLFSRVVPIDISGGAEAEEGGDGVPVRGVTPEEGGGHSREDGEVSGGQVSGQVESRRHTALALCAESSVDDVQRDVIGHVHVGDSNGSGSSSCTGPFTGEISDSGGQPGPRPPPHTRPLLQRVAGRLGTQHAELPTSPIQELTHITKPDDNRPQAGPLSYTHTHGTPSTGHDSPARDLPGKRTDFKAFLNNNNRNSEETSNGEQQSVQLDSTMAAPKGFKSALLPKKPHGLKSVLRNRNKDEDDPKEQTEQSELSSKGLKVGKATPVVKGFKFEKKSGAKRPVDNKDDKRMSGLDPPRKALVPPSKPLTEIIASRRSAEGTELAARLACVDIDIDNEKDRDTNGNTARVTNSGGQVSSKCPPKPPPKVKPAVPFKKVETKLKFQRQKSSSTDSDGPPTPPVADSQASADDGNVFPGSNVSPRCADPSPSPSRLSPAESTAAYIRASTPKGYAKGSVFTYTNLNKDRTSAETTKAEKGFPFYARVNKPAPKVNALKPSGIKLKLRENKKVSESKPRPTLPTKPGQVTSKLQSQAAGSVPDITNTIQSKGEESIYDDTQGRGNIDTGESKADLLYDDLAVGRGERAAHQVNTSETKVALQPADCGHTPKECYDDVEFPVRSDDVNSGLTTPGRGHSGQTETTAGGRQAVGAPSTGRSGQVRTGRHHPPHHSHSDDNSDRGDTRRADQPDITSELSDKARAADSEERCYEVLAECTSGRVPTGSLPTGRTRRSHQYDEVYADGAQPPSHNGAAPVTFTLPQGQHQQGTTAEATSKVPYGGEGIYEELPDVRPSKTKHNKNKSATKNASDPPESTKDGLNNNKNAKNAGGLVARLQFGRKGDKKATAKPQYTPIARIEPFRPAEFDEVYIEGRALKVQLNDLYDDLSVCKSVITKDGGGDKTEDPVVKPGGDIETGEVSSSECSTVVVDAERSTEDPPTGHDETAGVILRRPKGSKLKPPVKAQSLDSIQKSKSVADMDLASILRQRRPEDTVSLGSNAESVSSVESGGAGDGGDRRRRSTPADPAGYDGTRLGHSESDPALSEGAEGDPGTWSHDKHMKHLAKVNHKVNRALGAKHLSKLYVANIKEKTATFKNIPKYISKSATSFQEHLQGSRKSLGDLSEQVQRIFGLSKKEKGEVQKPPPSVPKPDYNPGHLNQHDGDDSDADWSDFDSDEDVGSSQQGAVGDGGHGGGDEDEDQGDYIDPDFELSRRENCYPPSSNPSDAFYLTPVEKEPMDVPRPPPVRPVQPSGAGKTPPPLFPRPKQPVPSRLATRTVGQAADSDEESSSDGYESPDPAAPIAKPVRGPQNRPPAPIPVPNASSRPAPVPQSIASRDLNRQQKPSPPPKPKTSPSGGPRPSAVRDILEALEKTPIPLGGSHVVPNKSVTSGGPTRKVTPVPHGKAHLDTAAEKKRLRPPAPLPTLQQVPLTTPAPAPLPTLQPQLQSPRSRDISPRRPLPPVPQREELDGLYPQPWYFGSLPRDAANNKLFVVGQDSTFLVRKTNSGGEDRPYTLTLVFNEKVWNLPIRMRSDKMYALGTEKGNEKTFSDVAGLIRYHQGNNLILAGSNGGETTLKHYPKKTGQ